MPRQAAPWSHLLRPTAEDPIPSPLRRTDYLNNVLHILQSHVPLAQLLSQRRHVHLLTDASNLHAVLGCVHIGHSEAAHIANEVTQPQVVQTVSLPAEGQGTLGTDDCG